MSKLTNQETQLHSEIVQLIEQSKQTIATAVNTAMSMLYWHIGKRMNSEVLQNKRAEYGKQVVVELSKKLQTEYGSSFSDKNLRRMMQFADIFSDNEIVVSVIR